MAFGYEESVRDELLRMLRKRILVVDEKPTLTRMFTFAGHIECVLLLRILGLLPDLIKMRGTQPRLRSRRRGRFDRRSGRSKSRRRTSCRHRRQRRWRCALHEW